MMILRNSAFGEILDTDVVMAIVLRILILKVCGSTAKFHALVFIIFSVYVQDIKI